eukprot:1145802-Pelagomonas_calceolata.AAC.4
MRGAGKSGRSSAGMSRLFDTSVNNNAIATTTSNNSNSMNHNNMNHNINNTESGLASRGSSKGGSKILSLILGKSASQHQHQHQTQTRDSLSATWGVVEDQSGRGSGNSSNNVGGDGAHRSGSFGFVSSPRSSSNQQSNRLRHSSSSSSNSSRLKLAGMVQSLGGMFKHGGGRGRGSKRVNSSSGNAGVHGSGSLLPEQEPRQQGSSIAGGSDDRYVTAIACRIAGHV